MDIEPLELDGLCLIRPARHGDARGWFEEAWSAPRLRAAGLDLTFEQDNLSYSAEAGTLRGLHFQAPPAAQGKLVSVITGAVLDVAVDVRSGSPTQGRHVAVRLCQNDPARLWVPEGFLHGFVTLEAHTRVAYKVTRAYSPEHDRCVAWNDPDLGIDWGLSAPVLSHKDAAAPRLRDMPAPFAPGWRERR
ncbi:MAG: dTDP-4-dehydrorhamnose 3,5-epimerase [Oceanicaulis sp.]|nr:dTDP-4-dehydrorhamnose 3,5-epimerase [Oceanicaulis sp.]